MTSKLQPHELALAQQNSFAQLVCYDREELVSSPAPVLYRADSDSFFGHLAMNNPCARVMVETLRASLLFQGQHQYISPMLHSEQTVPTWNFATLQLDCEIRLIQCENKKLEILTNLSQAYDPIWNMHTQGPTPKQLQQMLKAIMVFELLPTKIRSRFKLSQNKSMACRQRFAEKMVASGKDQLAQWQLYPPKEHRVQT